MDVEITQTVNEYPRWVADYSSRQAISIPESVPVNFEVGRFRATSTVPDARLNYFIARGDTPEQNGSPISFYSRLDELTNEMVLLTYRPLDYETLSRYTLTIKAAVSLINHWRAMDFSLGAIPNGRERGWGSWRGAATPPHQLEGLEELSL